MNKNSQMFSLGHAIIPFVLFSLYLFETAQPVLLLLAFLSAVWTFYLMWRTFIMKDLDSILRRHAFWWFLIVDMLLLYAMFVFPDWQDHLNTTWLNLLIVPLYAFELGVVAGIYASLFGLGGIVLYHFVQGGSFGSFDTLLNVIGIVIIIMFVGRSTDRLNTLAFFDALTLLPNRQMFKDRLGAAMRIASRKGWRLAILFVDLDNFKYVNDTMGLAAGDELLRTVAERIKKCLPKQAFLARMGGDEFMILLNGIGGTNAVDIVADAIIKAQKEIIKLEPQDVFITTSIGIAMFPEHGLDPDTLMKNADSAMYRAKQEGRNNHQYYTTPADADGIERIRMETMLRQAIERQQFVVYYQPRLSTLTDELVCVEALVRWQHPELGMIPPNDFIPLAEETGLIVPIGEQVLRMACEQRMRWTEMGLPLFRISVNLSGRQFQQPNLPGIIAKVLRKSGMPPSLLELEVTETAAMREVNTSIKMLYELKEMGLSLAIDDFGTGYSSLSYLKRFPIDVIKIDRSFMGGIRLDSDDAAIVRAIIVLAHTLKLKVTAEGVETSEQYDYLRRLNCNEIQGYLIGKPMHHETLEGWVALRESEGKKAANA